MTGGGALAVLALIFVTLSPMRLGCDDWWRRISSTCPDLCHLVTDETGLAVMTGGGALAVLALIFAIYLVGKMFGTVIS